MVPSTVESLTRNPSGPPNRNVAIFIDMENLFGGYSGDVGQVQITSILDDIRHLVTEQLEVGTAIAVTRAYANWSDNRLGKYRREMMERGVEPVQVFSFGQTVKNAADIEMVVDVLEVADRSAHVNVFVLVSGDGGFVPLIRRLHALGKFVIVATTESRSEKSASKLLKSVADYFLVSASLTSPVAQQPELQLAAKLTEVQPATPAPVLNASPDASPGPELVEVVRFIQSTLLTNEPAVGGNCIRDDDGRIDGTHLSRVLREKWTNISWRSLGYSSLGLLLKDQLGLEIQRPHLTKAESATELRPVPDTKPRIEGISDQDGSSLKVVDGAEEIELEVSKEVSFIVGPAARIELREQVGKIMGDAALLADIDSQDGLLNLSSMGSLLKERLPAQLRNLGGFTSLSLALRYCLSGTAFCVIESDEDIPKYYLTRRTVANAESYAIIDDLEETILGDADSVKDLLRRALPPLVFTDPAILRDVSELLLEARPVGTLTDLIDLVADELPAYYEAAEIRAALNLLVRCKVLVGTAEYLSLAPRFRGGLDVQEAIGEEVIIALESCGWPLSSSGVDELLGAGETWN